MICCVKKGESVNRIFLFLFYQVETEMPVLYNLLNGNIWVSKNIITLTDTAKDTKDGSAKDELVIEFEASDQTISDSPEYEIDHLEGQIS